jgi:hypothetical protein
VRGTGLLGRLRCNQQMKVLWHQNPADQQETRLWSKFAQDLHKIPAEAVIGKERVPAIGTGGQKLQLARLEVAWIKGHPYEISTRGLQEINRMAAPCASQPIKRLREAYILPCRLVVTYVCSNVRATGYPEVGAGDRPRVTLMEDGRGLSVLELDSHASALANVGHQRRSKTDNASSIETSYARINDAC